MPPRSIDYDYSRDTLVHTRLAMVQREPGGWSLGLATDYSRVAVEDHSARKALIAKVQ